MRSELESGKRELAQQREEELGKLAELRRQAEEERAEKERQIQRQKDEASVCEATFQVSGNRMSDNMLGAHIMCPGSPFAMSSVPQRSANRHVSFRDERIASNTLLYGFVSTSFFFDFPSVQPLVGSVKFGLE